jgi:hypothetical protein
MAQTALIEEIVREPATVRRFELADLSKHGPWLMKRFLLKFPNFTEAAIGGYLSGLVYDNGHMFLYQTHAVALAQLVHSAGIRPVKLVQERFVWVEDRNDKDQLEDAADFYTHMRQWGKRQDAERIVVCEESDVPKTLIEVRLGRIFDTKVSHARV